VESLLKRSLVLIGPFPRRAALALTAVAAALASGTYACSGPRVGAVRRRAPAVGRLGGTPRSPLWAQCVRRRGALRALRGGRLKRTVFMCSGLVMLTSMVALLARSYFGYIAGVCGVAGGHSPLLHHTEPDAPEAFQGRRGRAHAGHQGRGLPIHRPRCRGRRH